MFIKGLDTRDFKRYACVLCDKSFDTPEEAEECRNAHIKATEISSATYLSISKYPTRITITYEDGTQVLYDKIAVKKK